LSKKALDAIQRAKISPTDPEAALGYDKVGTYRPLYNLQQVKATDAPLVLAWELFSRNNDDGLLQPMMEKTEQQLGRHLEEVLVDGSYTSICGLLYCENHHIRVYSSPARPADAGTGSEPPQASKADDDPNSSTAPEGTRHDSGAARAEAARGGDDNAEVPERVRESNGGNGEEREPSRIEAGGEQTGVAEPPTLAAGSAAAKQKSKQEKKYGKELFRYDAVEEVFRCPEGKVLRPISRTTVQRLGGQELPMVVHQAEASDCAACQARQKCTGGKGGRTVKRYQGEEVVERLVERMRQAESQTIYRERKQTVELGYADLKEHRGLRVFRCFGIKRSRAQAGLTILASNALNIVRALCRREKLLVSHAG
jgi:hypothetical protein